jgi:acyl-coenzyme A thioesterase PaaI-like protein
MDYEQLRTMLASVVPFAKHVGVEITEITAGAASAKLPEAPHLLNHVGTQHAAALYSVAEAASGAAMAGLIADVLMSVTPLAKNARIAYLKPARGPITATARIDGDATAMRAKLDESGKTDFPVHVDLEDAAGVKVAEVEVAWYVRKNG